MGATMGSLFHFWKGYRNSPAVSYSYTSTHTYAHNLITHILKIPAYKKQAFKVNITQMIYILSLYTCSMRGIHYSKVCLTGIM